MKLSRLQLQVSMSLIFNIVFIGLRFTLLLDAVHQDASRALIGVLGAVISFFPMFLSLRMGRHIDHGGPRRPMMAACLAMAACGLAGFAQDSLWMLFLMAIFSGIANNAWLIAHQQLVGAFSKPGELAAGYGFSAMGFALGAMVAPMMAGLSIEHIGYAATFAWQGLLPLIPLFIVATRRMPLPVGSAGRAASRPAGTGASGLSHTFGLLKSPQLREVYIVSAMFEASWTLFSFLTPILGTQLGLAVSSIGMITGSISVTSFVARFFIPALVRRVPPWRILIASLAILSVGYLGFSLSPTVPLLVSFALVLGLGQAMGAPIINALLYEQAPPGRTAEVVGLRSTLNNFSQTVLPIASGALGAALGIAPAFWLLSAVIAAVSIKVRKRWHLKFQART